MLLTLFWMKSAYAENLPSFQWVATLSGEGNETVEHVMTDSQNNIISIGKFSGTVDFDPTSGEDYRTVNFPGMRNVFVTKLHRSGTYAWTLTFSDTMDFFTEMDSPAEIRIDSQNNIVIAGHYFGNIDFDPTSGIDMHDSNLGDMYVTKINSDGSYAWTQTFGGANPNYINGISLDGSGNIYLAGQFQDAADFDPSVNFDVRVSNGSFDLFIMKLLSDGSYGWVQTAGNQHFEAARGIVVKNNRVVVVGAFAPLIGETPLPVDFDPSSSIDHHTTNGLGDLFIMQLDTNGSYIFTITLGGPADDEAREVSFDIQNNLYVLGTFAETVDFNPENETDFHVSNNNSPDNFVMKLLANGDYAWTRTLGNDGGNDLAKSMHVDASGNVYLSGVFIFSMDFDPTHGVDIRTAAGPFGGYTSDIFLTKWLPNGNYGWTINMGSPEGLLRNNFDYGWDITLDSERNIVLAGSFAYTIDFDPGIGIENRTAYAWTDYTDGFILKLRQMRQPEAVPLGRRVEPLPHQDPCGNPPAC